MWVWFLAAAPVMLLPLQWRRRARWSLEKILLEEKQPRQRFWLNPSGESFRWWRRRLQAREIGLDLIWMWFLAAASVMSLLLQWRRKTCWSSREDLARGEDLVRSGICFGFCSWVLGAWKNKEVRLRFLKQKEAKLNQALRTQFLYDRTWVHLTRVRCLHGPSIHLNCCAMGKSSKLYSIYNSKIESFGLELLDTQIVSKRC